MDNAVIFLLDRSLSHLEKPGITVRIMFFDFSSAFNAIQLALLGDKLEPTGVNQHLTSWILDYLTNRQQYVRTRDYELDTIICSTGAPQGTVLAPFLFTLHTAEFYHQSPHSHLQRFSDGSAIVGLIRDRTTEPTENLFRNLWTGAIGTTSSSTPGRPKCWWWIYTGIDNPAYR